MTSLPAFLRRSRSWGHCRRNSSLDQGWPIRTNSQPQIRPINAHRCTNSRHHTQFSMIYYYHWYIKCGYFIFDPEFQGITLKVTIFTYIFCEFPDIELVILNTKHKFLWYTNILPKICILNAFVMFDLEFPGQRSRSQHWYVLFKFPDIDLIDMNTQITFLLQVILNNV